MSFDISKRKITFFVLGILIIITSFNIDLRKKVRNLILLCKFKSFVYADPACGRALNYRLYSPKLIKNNTYPLVIYLHGGAERGADNKKQITSSYAGTWIKSDFQKKNPCYVLAPQCPKGMEWVTIRPKSIPYGHYQQDRFPEGDEMKSIISLINTMIKEKPIDINRIYISGFSMGGTGTWDIITRHPNIFAGALIASGETDTSKAYLIKDIPIWSFSGEDDTIVYPEVSEKMVNAVNRSGGNAKFTLFKNTGHNPSGSLAFNYPGAREWLFDQVRK